MKKFCLYLSFMAVSVSAHSTQIVKDISSSEIITLRTHTSLISSDSLKNVATLKTTVMEFDGKCTKGGYLQLDNNTATYSAMLATHLAGKNMSIQYDTDTGIDGDSSDYCAILYFDINS